MVEQPDPPDPSPTLAHLAATWQDHPVVRLVLFGAAFACGLVAIDAADPPFADDLRFAWMAVVPFGLAFVVRHALWPVAAAAAYHLGTWAPNAAYDRPIPVLGDLQPLFPALTALAGLGIVWTGWGFWSGYAEPTPPPVFGDGPVRHLRARLAAVVLAYALGLAILPISQESSWFLPWLGWLVLGPLVLAPLARAWLWPSAAALLAGGAAAVLVADIWRHAGQLGFGPDGRWPAAGVAAVIAASLAWTMACAGFVAAHAVGRLRERWHAA